MSTQAESNGAAEQREELCQAYETTLRLYEARIQQLEHDAPTDIRGRPYDDHGTVVDYRTDARYCAYRMVEFTPTKAETKADADERLGRSREIPTDPKKLSEIAFKRRRHRPAPLPDPDDEQARRKLRLEDFMRPFSQRQAEAMILVWALDTPAPVAARFMNCSTRTVERLLAEARKHFTEARSYRNLE